MTKILTTNLIYTCFVSLTDHTPSKETPNPDDSNVEREAGISRRMRAILVGESPDWRPRHAFTARFPASRARSTAGGGATLGPPSHRRNRLGRRPREMRKIRPRESARGAFRAAPASPVAAVVAPRSGRGCSVYYRFAPSRRGFLGRRKPGRTSEALNI